MGGCVWTPLSSFSTEPPTPGPSAAPTPLTTELNTDGTPAVTMPPLVPTTLGSTNDIDAVVYGDPPACPELGKNKCNLNRKWCAWPKDSKGTSVKTSGFGGIWASCSYSLRDPAEQCKLLDAGTCGQVDECILDNGECNKCSDVNCEGRDLATTLTIVGVILVAGVGLGIWRWWWCNRSEDSEDHETDSESDPEITETEDWTERQQRTVRVF